MSGLPRLIYNKSIPHAALSWNGICTPRYFQVPRCYKNETLNQYYSSSSLPYEYLQQSIVPTMHFQASLPRLPIPKLDVTCERYLRSQRPLLNDNSYENTTNIVKAFLDGQGQELNNELIAIDKKNKHTSYITGHWFNMYLEARDPLVLNYNPFICFKLDERPEYNHQVIRSTNMIVSAMRFLKTMRSNILSPEIYHLNPAKSDTQRFKNIVRWVPSSLSWYVAYLYKAFPLDMSQYSNLFNSTRIPKQNKDELYTDVNARHIVVIRNGQFYTFDVLTKEGGIVAASEIQAHLEFILSDKSPVPQHPVAALTSQERNTWASYRAQLEECGNKETLKLIDSAVFALCLEDDKPGEDPFSLTRLLLYGDSANRWFDKCFQLIICKDGIASVNFEHSWGDGVAVIRFMNETFEDSKKRPAVEPGSTPADVNSSEYVRKLDWKLTPAIQHGINEAQDIYNKTTQTLGINLHENVNLNKEVFKKYKISPDAMMQLSFQMGYYRMSGGKTVATYESCSTAAFKHGRTETLRSATIETKACCEAFNKPGVGIEDKRQLLTACSKKHNELTKDAAMGQGWDRHLFALRVLANQCGQQSAMFNDEAYKAINHIILSTSTVTTPSILIGGFAPVVPDGLGVGYQAGDDRVGVTVTSYPSSPNAAEFVQCVESSLNDIYHVLSNSDK